MAASSAELSSLATALDELTRRVTVHAEAADAAKDEETARELFAIERSLASANRRLARLALTLSAADGAQSDVACTERSRRSDAHRRIRCPDAAKAPRRVPSRE